MSRFTANGKMRMNSVEIVKYASSVQRAAASRITSSMLATRTFMMTVEHRLQPVSSPYWRRGPVEHRLQPVSCLYLARLRRGLHLRVLDLRESDRRTRPRASTAAAQARTAPRRSPAADRRAH